MNLKKACFGVLAASCLVTGSLVAEPANAQHFYGRGYYGHGGYWGHGFGWGVGLGVVVAPGLYYGPGWGYWGYGPWYDYPPYYYPPAVAVPAAPTAYVERSDGGQTASVQPPSYDWYHCDNPSGYYPYVKECPSGWQRVAPQPPGSK
jgi:hypothetical protein